MDLGDLYEVVVYYILIERMVLINEWVFHGEYTSVYGHMLDKTYGESWHWLSSSYDLPTMLHGFLTLRGY